MKSVNSNTMHNRTASDLMPSEDAILRVLIEHGHMHAKNPVTNTAQSSFSYYIKFKLGKMSYYGIPYDRISEVINNYLLTPIPNVPRSIAGVINLRGILIAIIDLKAIFNIPYSVASEATHIIVINNDSMTVGILVDSIEGKDVYDQGSLDMATSAFGISSDYILGISQSNTAIINVDRTLADLSQQLTNKS